MASGEIVVTHQGIDIAAGSREHQPASLTHLRRLLVSSGVLPPRDEPFAALERSVERRLATLHPEDATVIRAYATWHVMAGARQRIAAGRPSQSVCHTARSAFGVPVALANSLRQQGHSLEAIPQHVIDDLTLPTPGTYLPSAPS